VRNSFNTTFFKAQVAPPQKVARLEMGEVLSQTGAPSNLTLPRVGQGLVPLGLGSDDCDQRPTRLKQTSG
jgi:hypothetical protein